MGATHYFYSPLPVGQLSEIITHLQTEFDHLLSDQFTETELVHFEAQIDSIAAVSVGPILSELTFDDFYADENFENAQREFFSKVQSCWCLENLPYLESHPLQVTYLKYFLKGLGQLLIDQGGVSNLCFKEDYLKVLEKYKDIDLYQPKEEVVKKEVRTFIPVEPIDFLILDVYQELARLKNLGIIHKIPVQELNEKVQGIFFVMKDSVLNADELLRATKLGAKNFDDGLERLKFWLRKQPS